MEATGTGCEPSYSHVFLVMKVLVRGHETFVIVAMEAAELVHLRQLGHETVGDLAVRSVVHVPSFVTGALFDVDLVGPASSAAGA